MAKNPQYEDNAGRKFDRFIDYLSYGMGPDPAVARLIATGVVLIGGALLIGLVGGLIQKIWEVLCAS